MKINNIAIVSFAIILCLQPFVTDAVSTFMRARQEAPVVDTNATGVSDNTTVVVDNTTAADNATTADNATAAGNATQCFDPNTWTADPNISQTIETYGQNLSTDLTQLRQETEDISDKLNDDEVWYTTANNTDFASLQAHYWAIYKLVRVNISQDVQINGSEVDLLGLQCIQSVESNQTAFNALNQTEQQCARSIDPALPWLWNFTVATYKNDSATAIYYLLETLQFWQNIQKDCFLSEPRDEDDDEDDSTQIDTIEFETEDYDPVECRDNMIILAGGIANLAQNTDLLFSYDNREDIGELYFDTIANCIGAEN